MSPPKYRPMQLLVSVADARDARAAVDGGADIIDAKDPSAGALGAVSLDVLAEIVEAVDGRRPVTAAIGDAADEADVERLARAFVAAGPVLVKVGFAGVTDVARATALARAAVRGAGEDRVIVVAYADAARVGSLPPEHIIEVAVGAGAAGVLVDTADKQGPGLFDLLSDDALDAWVREARAAGLLVALAGRLAADDLPRAIVAGANVAGVRGAACEGGRGGRIVADRVRILRERCGGASVPLDIFSSGIGVAHEGTLE